MGGQPKIYVDFSVRDPEGRFYSARLADFDQPPALSSTFVGTDLDEFEVECIVLAIDHRASRVYHRPVRAAEVPGTHPDEATVGGHAEGAGLNVSSASEPVLIPA